MVRVKLFAGTLGGTFFSVLSQFDANELVRTAVLAAVGASVSFAVTLLLQRLTRRRD